MKYVSIDLETTGLDRANHQILEFAAVIEDGAKPTRPVEELPYFRAYLKHKTIVGDPFAIFLNREIIGKISRNELPDQETGNGENKLMPPAELYTAFKIWLSKWGLYPQASVCDPNADFKAPKITVGGKNVASFDRPFLSYLPHWFDDLFHHRSIDPLMYYWHPRSDKEPPRTEICCERAGIKFDDGKFHNALYDARLIIELVRRGPAYFAQQYKNGAFSE